MFAKLVVSPRTSSPTTTEPTAVMLKRERTFVAGALVVLGPATGCMMAESNSPGSNGGEDALLVAHRGASGYAPEHTLAAYRLGIEQGADFIEPDLQISSDGVLVALHDLTLERTTNVADVFPDRFKEEEVQGEQRKVWYANDFTLDELKQLDAGSWMSAEHAGARIPTLREVIEVARGRAGIFPETKAPEVYGDRGFSMERLLLAELEIHGLAGRDADPETPVILQSFSEESLRILKDELGSDLPRIFLLPGPDAGRWLTAEALAGISDFATGIGPAKRLLLENPGAVERAHAAGLTVVPYTFRAGRSGDFASVEDEMSHFLYDLRVDGLFTDNPDLFPRSARNDS